MATAPNNGGQSNTDGRRFVSFGFQANQGCIPDATMQEVVRRLTGYVSASTDIGYIRSVGPPADLTATWVPVDANGNRVGNNRVYDPASGQWVDDFGSGLPGIIFVSAVEGNQIVIAADQGIYVSPKKYAVINQGISTSGTAVINFPNFNIDVNKIGVNWNHTSDPGDNPHLRIYLESLTDGVLKLKVLGFDNSIVPSLNLRIEIYQLD